MHLYCTLKIKCYLPKCSEHLAINVVRIPTWFWILPLICRKTLHFVAATPLSIFNVTKSGLHVWHGSPHFRWYSIQMVTLITHLPQNGPYLRPTPFTIFYLIRQKYKNFSFLIIFILYFVFPQYFCCIFFCLL